MKLFEITMKTCSLDEARYRWLRDGNYPLDFAKTVLNDSPLGIDTAIDAAMKTYANWAHRKPTACQIDQAARFLGVDRGTE